jgi:hypothetical protein
MKIGTLLIVPMCFWALSGSYKIFLIGLLAEFCIFPYLFCDACQSLIKSLKQGK